MFTYSALVTRVIDGDTYDLTIDLGFRIDHRIRVRLAGVDCPEAGTEKGTEATAVVKHLIEGQRVQIRSYKPDKYGRWLVDVTLDDESDLAVMLLSAGLAAMYA